MIPVELRTQPLIDIGAYFTYPKSPTKHLVRPAWRIARCAFNDLGDVWKLHQEWFASQPLTVTAPLHKVDPATADSLPAA